MFTMSGLQHSLHRPLPEGLLRGLLQLSEELLRQAAVAAPHGLAIVPFLRELMMELCKHIYIYITYIYIYVYIYIYGIYME